MATLTESNQPCPCGESNSFATYDDGSGYCFYAGCDSPLKKRAATQQTKPNPNSKEKPMLFSGAYKKIRHRGLDEDVCRQFGLAVQENEKGDIQYEIYQYRDPETGEHVANFVKDLVNKRHRTEGSPRKAGLFGQHLFPAGGRAVTITEGEADAASAYQMTGKKFPFISILNGIDGALKECQAQYEYLNSFSSIVIDFDNDDNPKLREKVTETVNKIARLFPGKSYVLSKHNGLKDANEYRKNGKDADYVRAWWQAEKWKPDGIVAGSALLDIALKPMAKGVPTVWQKLTELTGGIRPHEIWTFGAGTGMGKTELFKEIGYDLAINQGKKAGFILLEDPTQNAALSLISKHMNKRLHLEQVREEVTDEEIQETGKELFVDKDLFYIHDHKGNSEFENIESILKYMVYALECDFVFLDHITAMAEGKEDSNINAKIHSIMESLNKLVQSAPFTIMMNSHLNQRANTPHEEGGRVRLIDFYGSGAIKQRSNFVFGLEGNQQEEGAQNLRTLRCLKDRNAGSATGQMVPLEWDTETGRLEQTMDVGPGIDEGLLEDIE